MVCALESTGYSLADIHKMLTRAGGGQAEYADMVQGIIHASDAQREIERVRIGGLTMTPRQRRKVDSNIRRLKRDLKLEYQGSFDGITGTLKGALQVADSMDALIDKISTLVAKTTNEDFVDDVVKRFEQFLLTLIALNQQSTAMGAVAVLAQYVSTLCTRSFSKIIMDTVKSLLQDRKLHYQSGFLTRNWKSIVDGPFGSAIGKIMSLLITVGFLPAKATTNLGRGLFEMFRVKRFSDDGSSLPAVIDCTVSTLDWVVDSVWPAAATGNIAMLFQGEELNKLDDEYRKVVDCVDLYMSNSFELLKKKYDVSDSGFEIVRMIDECMESHTQAKKKPDLSSFQRNTFDNRLLSLNKFSNGIQGVFKSTAIRVRPYTFLLRGGSGVNKTGLNEILIHVISKANDLPSGPEYHCQLNGADPYMMDYRPKHISISFDDLCNTKPEHEEVSPLYKIIQFVNNVHCTALSAEAHMKGKNSINVKIVSATTNTEAINSAYFSCNPSSIMSRFNLIIDVALKSTATDSRGKIKKSFIGIPYPDMWDVTASWVKVTRLDKLRDSWCLVKYDGVDDLVSLIDLVEKDSRVWFSDQARIVESATNLKTTPHCEQHPLYALPCLKCQKVIRDGLESGTFDPTCPPIKEIAEFEYQADEESVCDDESTSVNWENLSQLSMPLTSFETCVNDITYTAECMVEDAVGLVKQAQSAIARGTETLCGEIRQKFSELSSELEKADPMYKGIVAVSLVFGIIIVGSQFKKALEEQASIEEVDAVAMPPQVVVNRQNAYKKPVRFKMDAPNASKTATPQQFIDKMDTSLYLVFITPVLNHEGELAKEKNAVASFPIGSGNWILPYHPFKLKSPIGQYHLDYRMASEDVLCKRFSEIVMLEDIQKLAGSDLCSVYLRSGGSNYDMSKFVQKEEFKLERGTVLQILPKTRDMVQQGILPSQAKIFATVKECTVVNVKDSQYYAVTYTTTVDTYKGLCGAPIVTTGVNPTIVGIHTAGVPCSTDGVGALFIQSDLVLEQQSIRIAEKAPLSNEQLGASFEVSGSSKWKNPIHWIPVEDQASLEIHGQHDQPTTSFRTSVKKSILADKLDEIGIPTEHAGPLANAETMARQKHLSNCTKVQPPYNPMFMKMSVKDFEDKLIGAVRNSNGKIKEYVHPISYKDALNGVDGVTGFDCLPPNTSPGFPLTGPKWKLCVEEAIQAKKAGKCARLLVQPEEGEGSSSTFEFVFDKEKVDVYEEVSKLLANFGEKVRSNVIFKIHLKDEALPLEKVLAGSLRCIAGAPMHFVVATRMLFSSLNVLMTQFPTLFETAVGCNAQGKDWDFIGKYLLRKGRVAGGDFSKYDQLTRQMMLLAFEILKGFMKECDFPSHLLDLLDGVACEICFPNYEVNGVLLEVLFSNPSGHPLTVIINSIVNSLLMRYCYYAMHFKAGDSEIPPFHSMVDLLTYGDDNVYGVDEKEKLFNHISVAYELSLIGMKYTMPDKNSEPQPFMNPDEVDFLKRKFRVHESTGTMIGALDVKSIYKSLTTTMKVKGREETEAQVMAGNIANALRELWIHGPEVFREHKRKFECLKEIQDGVYRVGDFWQDVTEEECLERYENTWCVYQECLDVTQMPYEYQAAYIGEWMLDSSEDEGYSGEEELSEGDDSMEASEYDYEDESLVSEPDPEHVEDMFRSRAGLLRFISSEARVYEQTGVRPATHAFMLFATAPAVSIMLRKPTRGQIHFAHSQLVARQKKKKSVSNEILCYFASMRTGVIVVHPAYDVVRKTYGVTAAFRAARLVWRLTRGKWINSTLFRHADPDLARIVMSFAEPSFSVSSAFRTEYGSLSYIYTLY